MRKILFVLLISITFACDSAEPSPYSPNGILSKRQQDSIIENIDRNSYLDSTIFTAFDYPLHKSYDPSEDTGWFLDSYYQQKMVGCNKKIYYFLAVQKLLWPMRYGIICVIVIDNRPKYIKSVGVFHSHKDSEELYRTRGLFWKLINGQILEKEDPMKSYLHLNENYARELYDPERYNPEIVR